MNEQEKALNDAIVNAVKAYSHNLPDVIEMTLQILFRELYNTVGSDLQEFRDLAIETIELT